MAHGLREAICSAIDCEILHMLEVIMKRFVVLVFAMVFIVSSFVMAAEPGSIAPFDEKAYNEYLTESLKDPNLGIRFSAAKLLGERRVYEAKDELVNMLKRDKEYQNRIAAGLALMEIGDENVYNELVKQSKKDKCKTVRHVLVGVTAQMQNQTYLTINN